MKEIKITVPDNQAELFAEKLSALVSECNGKVSCGSDTTENNLFDTRIPIWERIKTIEDAIAYTGMTLPENIEELPLDVQAFLKLRIICAAYNELKADELDKFPMFTTGEYRYYPWFCLYTQAEIDKMDEDERSRVLGRSYNYASAYAGVAYAYTYSASSPSLSSHGGRLCFKNEELATECGARFVKLWAQFFCFITEQ